MESREQPSLVEIAELEVLHQKTKHPLSQKLPVFESQDHELWTSIMEEYSDSKYDIDPSRFDFLIKDKCNTGWKLHLNVLPQNVREVSEFLIHKMYWHKYLFGGEADMGKIFTIYVGSRAKTEEVALHLTKELRAFLARPIDHNEIEFTEGVIGRFCVNRSEFKKYGTAGMDTLRSAFGSAIEALKYSPEKWKQIELATYRRIKELFGEYFTGKLK